MHITRIYNTPNGTSHFENVDIELTEAGEIGSLSERFAVSGIVFRENPSDYDYDWHNAPQRQYVVMLDGNIEIEVSDGEVRRFTGGDILLVEDTTGRGHKTRTVDGKSRRSVFVVI